MWRFEIRGSDIFETDIGVSDGGGEAQKLLFMGEEWHRKTIATIRWKLVEVEGLKK